MFSLSGFWHSLVPQILPLSCLLLAAVEATNIIPHPNGTYGIGLNIVKLTDKKRPDPYNPKQPRSVMLSAFYPVGPLAKCNTTIVDYMPPATAKLEDEYFAPYGLPNNTFESLKLSVCQTPCRTDPHPLILFSPGLSMSRLLYSALAQSIASHGYIVLTIDHPYDATVVEYPDGTLILGANITSDAQVEFDVGVRVKDVSFILDALSIPSTVHHLIPSAHSLLNTTHVLMTGHSLGGATAAAAMLSESRLIGGVDLDGTFFGPVIQKGLAKPFLIFGHEGKNQSTDETWKEIWKELRGWKRELELKGSQHGTFTDLPVLADVLGLRNVLPGVDGLLGSIKGSRAREVISTYLAAFAGFVEKGAKSRLLEGNVKEYPEVVVVAK